ncbi:MAG: ABC transporter substrate-binding protein [Aggregatilineales bacterium]
MKLFVRLFLLSLLLSLAFSAVSAQDEMIVIDFYYPSAVDANLQALFERYAEMFSAQNPNVTVNVNYTGSYTQTRDTIRTELDAGQTGPDVAVMLAIDLFSFIENGSIMPAQMFIDQMEDGEAFVADFFPAFLLNSVDEDGVIWSIPFQRSTPILYYNKDLFAEAGLDPEQPPRSLEELIEFADLLTTDDRWGFMLPIAGGFPIWLYQSFAIAHGQNLVEESPAEVFFNTPEGLAALQAINDLGNLYGVMPAGGTAWGETPEAFTAGRAAMIYHTTGSLTSILNNAPFEVGTGFLASGPANEDGTGYGAPTGGGNLYIFNDPNRSEAELEAIWNWVMFLASPEIQSDWGAATGYIAARQSAWELDPLASLVEEFPQYAVARDQLAFSQKEFSSFRTIDIQGIINTTLSGIISGDVTDAAAALATAQAQIDALLEPYRQ